MRFERFALTKNEFKRLVFAGEDGLKISKGMSKGKRFGQRINFILGHYLVELIGESVGQFNGCGIHLLFPSCKSVH